MRLQLLANVLQNSFCGIFDGFIIEHLLRGVDQRHLNIARFTTLEQLLVEAIRLAHTTTNFIALVGALEELLGCREA